jgi:polyisoprenyl-phosphate glycosyltransferase
VPLRIGIAIGLVSSTFAFLGTAYAIVGWWVDDAVVPGWASSVAMMSFLFGVLFAFLAVLAEYVGRIVVEVRRRPRFLVRETTRPVLAAADRRVQRLGTASDGRAEG